MRTNNVIANDVDTAEIARLTKNYSGAEISGLVRAASSFAFSRHIKVGTVAGISDDVADIKVTRRDFMAALDETTPLFGVAEEELSKCLENGILPYSPNIDSILSIGRDDVAAVRNTNIKQQLLATLLHGPPGSGKTALAAKMAMDSEFPFIKLISPQDMVGFSEMMKVQNLDKVFRDADKVSLLDR
jgi:vesicle-fusing ATPase